MKEFVIASETLLSSPSWKEGEEKRNEIAKHIFENDRICFLPLHTKADQADRNSNYDRENEFSDSNCFEENFVSCKTSIYRRKETMKEKLVIHFWPMIKQLVKICSCKDFSKCVSGIVGWDCVHDSECTCFKAICISREVALETLRVDEMETDQMSEICSIDSWGSEISSASVSDTSNSSEEEFW